MLVTQQNIFCSYNFSQKLIITIAKEKAMLGVTSFSSDT